MLAKLSDDLVSINFVGTTEIYDTYTGTYIFEGEGVWAARKKNNVENVGMF